MPRSDCQFPKNIHKLRYFNQNDARWAHVLYSAVDDPAQTIGTSGCIPCQQAMLICNLLKLKVNPRQMAELNLKQGYRTINSGTMHAALFALNVFGIHTVELPISTEEMNQALEAGGLISVSGKLRKNDLKELPGSCSGHIYGITRINEETNEIWVLDPDSVEKSKKPHPIATLLPTIRKVYASFYEPNTSATT